MGGVAVLNPHDVLRHGFSYNRMPLISTSPSTNPSTFKDSSRDANPNSNHDPKTVSSPNRRKRSPQNQKKTKDLSRISSPKNSNVLPRFTDGPSLEMGKVTILRRGQALDDDEKKKKIVLFDKVIKKEKKTVSFDKENKIENKSVLFDKVIKEKKKSELLDKNKKKENEKKRLVFDKKIVEEEKTMLLMRLGPEPGMVPRFYAGSAFVDSPSPRLVPLPSFLAEETKDDYGHASSYLRSLLKLGF